VDREESLKPEMVHRRATNSPPVPAILNKVTNFLLTGQLKKYNFPINSTLFATAVFSNHIIYD
jgi:hypothetical protein